MALSRIVFNRGQEGLGRSLPGSDHISGKLFYTAGSLPPGFGTSDRIKKIFSLKDAENLGILDDHADETKGTGGVVLIAGTWIIGETSSILIDGAFLGTFTATATTIADQVAGLVAAINAGTSTGLKHGWSAVDTASTTVTLTQPDKLGIFNNGGSHITFATDSASGTGTPTQFTGGVGSYFAIIHYHISEYFRLQPKGVTFVGIFAQNSFDGAEIETIQNFADGEIRQLGILLTHEVFASSQLTVMQGKLDTLEGQDKPMSALLHSDLSSATLSTLADLTTLSNERTSMLIGEEGDFHQPAYDNDKNYLAGEKVTFQGAAYIAKINTVGNSPWDTTKWTFLRENLQAINGFSIGTMGVALGAVSFALVSDSIAFIAKFPLVTETGLDEVAFATGDLWKDVAVNLKDTLDDQHYIFLIKETGISGTFFNDSKTAITAANDFATIENVRTIDKAVRTIRINELPNLNGPLFVDADGKLTEDTIAVFKNDAQRAINQMVVDLELSPGSKDKGVTIDPDQNVLATSKIVIGVKLIPVGVAREIEINIGFVVSLT